MSYQLYRNTTLGNSLQESLDELIQVNYLYLVGYNKKMLSRVVSSGRNRGAG